MERMTDELKQEMRKLRARGLSVGEIAKATGFSVSSVATAVKDVSMPVAYYSKTLLVALSEGTIVDVETTGLEPATDELITFGSLMGNQIRVLQRVDAAEREFCELVRNELETLRRPLYAYNASFDANFLNAKLGQDIEMVDIMEPWRVRAEREGWKWPSLDELAPLPREYYGERQTTWRQVVSCWDAYLARRDMRPLSLIVRHNMEDLVQALYLLAHVETER
jgi:uncharacterized protein YprB with RNaseH-like and TPR domain